ncbi:hypothetical protein ABFT80_22875 [Mesorhizobium sp. SB112]|uniref:hypothetical protein n=1 Tax=Mesorhizobium sp. SB112 TaxID=3151853 RepID=UPI00326699B5
MLEQFASFVTTYLLYLMLSVPFIVWSGRTTYASIEAHGGKPGRGVTYVFAIFPLVLTAYYILSGIGGTREEDFDIGPTTAFRQERVSDWGPYLFLSLPPAWGLLAGYVIANIVSRRNAGKA